MLTQKNIIEHLTAFRSRNKFSDRAWHDRGLNPSSIELSSQLTALFNQCADALINAVNEHASDGQLKRTMKLQLSNFDKRDYDTEERAFICDLFYELAQILEIDFSDEMGRWIYGWPLNMLLKIHAKLFPERIVDVIKQTCSSCGGAIDSFILRKEEGIPDYAWNIVRCKSCKDYLLVSIGPNVKEFRYGNYIPVEQLSKELFTREQAEIRVEQLRYFRK